MFERALLVEARVEPTSGETSLKPYYVPSCIEGILMKLEECTLSAALTGLP